MATEDRYYDDIKLADEEEPIIHDIQQRIKKRAAKNRVVRFVLWSLIVGCLVAVYTPWHLFTGRSMSGMAGKPGNVWPTPDYCELMESKRCFDVSWNGLKKFDFLEHFVVEVEDGVAIHHQPQRGFQSTIQLLSALEDQTDDVKVLVQMKSSTAFLVEHVGFETSNSSMTLSLPSPWKQDRDNQGCLFVVVSLFLRQGVTLDDLSISANVSNVLIPKDINFTINNSSTITLLVGNLHAASTLPSRKTYIDVDAGSVSGKYNLYDTLSISTKAGSIKADIIPQKADKEDPVNAELKVSSGAGSVDINFPPEGIEIPERDYYTAISTGQGIIHGSYLHGRNTSLSTHAGSINANILPYASDLYESTLSVTTEAGSQNILLRSPYLDPGKSIKRLSSRHRTRFSSLKLHYPPEWEGRIEGKTVMGSLRLEGDDVRVIEEGKVGFAGHFVKAEKGDGESEFVFGSEMGSVSVVVG